MPISFQPSASSSTFMFFYSIFFFYIIGFPEVPGLKLLQSHNPAQRAATQHNNDICEWTCLYGPLPHTEDMISEEWKPFEKFIFKQNTGSRRAAAWRCEAQSHSAGRWAHVRSSVYLPVFSPWLYYTSLCVCLHRGFVGFSLFHLKRNVELTGVGTNIHSIYSESCRK